MSPSSASLAADLASACRRWPHRPATTGGGITWTYRELGAGVARLAKSYRELGIRPGDRVVCGLRDRPELVAAVHAAWACGAIHVGVHNDLTGPELLSVVERTDATALVFQPGRRDVGSMAPLATVAQRAPETRRIILDGPVGSGEWSLAEMLDVGSSHSDIPPPPPAGTLPIALFLTSGTTGRPKAAVETFPALRAKVQFFADSVGPGPEDVHLMYLPMGHAFGLKLSLLALLSGGHLVLLQRFTPEAALASISEHQVTVLPGTPTHFTLLLDALDERRHHVASLRWGVSAAAPFSRELAQRVYGRLGIELLSVYGCSEGFLVTTTRREDILAGSVGRTVFGAPSGSPPSESVEVVDLDDGTPLPAGAMGEIRFSSSAPVRYWGEPPVADDGWYRSGDIGRIDPDGRLYVLGRTKDVINRGGLKVSSGEVEAALCQHPQVSDGAVVAAPDPVLGEAIRACVVPAGPTIPTLAELRSFLGVNLARHKLPDELCLVQEIPRSDRQAGPAGAARGGGWCRHGARASAAPVTMPSVASTVPTVQTSDRVAVGVHDLGGGGIPVVLAHATGMHGLVWRPLVEHLGPGWHCLAFDARGHGDSGAFPDATAFSWEELARDILAVVDGLGLERPVGIGHSSGATALLLAEQDRPGLFRGLYCYEPVIVPVDPPLGRDPDNALAAAARRRRRTFASRQEASAHYTAKPPLSVWPRQYWRPT